MLRVSVFLGFVAVAGASDATGAASATCPGEKNQDFKSTGCKSDGGDCNWIWLDSDGGICTKCNSENPSEKLDTAYATAIGGKWCPAAQDITLDCPTELVSNGCEKKGYDCKYVLYNKAFGDGVKKMCTKCNAEGVVLTQEDAAELSPKGEWCPLLAGETMQDSKNVPIEKTPIDKEDRPFECTDVKVIHDVLDHWMDGCLGLVRQTPKTSPACEEACKKDMACSVWQFSAPTDGEGHCDYGAIETNCRSRDNDPDWQKEIKGGQRIQHGSFEVVSDNKGTKFADNLMQIPISKDQAMTDEALALLVTRCKEMCVSVTTCTVWQFFKASGCWIEAGSTSATIGWDKVDTVKLKDMLGGETIKHTCPKPAVVEDTNWPLIIGLIVAGVLALGAILYMVLKPKPKVKKTRAVKIAQEEVVPLFIPQPTILIPQAPVAVQVAPQYTLVQQPSIIYTR